MRGRIVMVVGMLALAASAVQADKLYKWVDKQGRVTYHDTPPTSDEYRVEEKDVRLRGSRETPVDRPPVLLYSAPDCQSCDLAREYLKKRQVPFTEKNASGDVKVQEELKKKVGTLSVPVLLVGEKVMKGYLESLLAGELDQAGYPKIAELQSGAAAPEKRERESLAPAP